ncbi:REP-associated tyrosine transposase [Stratiformator vulcanicus]|uniref:Transposase IS200 like protein n=1 Tax=Stratiformator vulcanicus TaxID=2527980 RepID=A0A517R1D0_9PLAN|nr:transposase [Stratiformator vulcanicus]QDT37644.1 Transposase IS200 like protein [Stratiformator vulcanicus]
MTNRRRVIDDERHVHFVTTSCYKRRRLFDSNLARDAVVSVLREQLVRRGGVCLGFVIMPDHAHLLVWFDQPGHLSAFMDKWKELSSKQISQILATHFRRYFERLPEGDPVWQARYYCFNVFSEAKTEEKLNYMHDNPVRANLVKRAIDWRWSSDRWYEDRSNVGVPISWPTGLFE